MEYGDNLYIYDGNSTSANRIGIYNRYNKPTTITATNSGGALTLYFYADRDHYTAQGFEATISCSNPPCNPGLIQASRSSICAGDTATLTLKGYSSGSLIQWQGSADGVSYYNISGANKAVYKITGQASYAYYRAVLICSGATSGSAVTNPLFINRFTVVVSAQDTLFCSSD